MYECVFKIYHHDMNKWNHGTLKCHNKLYCDCEPNLVTFRHHLLFRHHISSEHTHTFPQPPALNVQTFQIILLFIPPSISLSWCSVVDVKLTPLGGTRLWHHTCQQPEVSLGKIVVYQAQDSQSFLQKSQQSCSLLLQWEKKENGISVASRIQTSIATAHALTAMPRLWHNN